MAASAQKSQAVNVSGVLPTAGQSDIGGTQGNTDREAQGQF